MQKFLSPQKELTIRRIIYTLPLIIFITVYFSLPSSNTQYDLIKMNQELGGKCLDGSAPSIYVKNSKYRTDKSKFIFFFKGGGWCYGYNQEQVLKECYKRSKTTSGSSDKLDDTKQLKGIFSAKKFDNPYFYDYTVVYVNYCDGAGHQGSRKEPLLYNGNKIWMRGQENVLTILDYAKQQLGMSQAEEVIIAGTSAGGLAASVWADYISQDLKNENPNINVFAVADAGYFLDHPTYDGKYVYQNKMKNLLALSNENTNYINNKCQQKYQNEPWKCMFQEYLLEFIETQIFISISSYDVWQIQNILGIKCLDGYGSQDLSNCNDRDMLFIDQYHDELQESIQNIQNKNSIISSWVISCPAHNFLRSAPSIYVKPFYQKTDKSKFIFWFEGGGWCYGETELETLQDCYKRSQEKRGSSNFRNQTMKMDGILSSDKNINPHFYDYTVIYLNYCDGTGYQGYVEEQISFDIYKSIWMRGKQNFLTSFKYAKEQMKMDQADTVIVSGTSAGGLAAFTWLDYIADDLKKINSNINVIGLPCAGLFLDYKSFLNDDYVYQNKMRNLLEISNFEQGYVNKDCQRANILSPWKCMFTQYLIDYIKTPVLMIQSSYDNWQIPNILEINCVKGTTDYTLNKCNLQELQYINQYHSEYTAKIQEILNKKQNVSAWLIACACHDFLNKKQFNSKDWEIPQFSRNTVSQVSKRFVDGENLPIHDVNEQFWPTNIPCSYVLKNKEPTFRDLIKENFLKVIGFLIEDTF
ncbi:hypothetical protein PPERSA_12241 [Pseudocohnilembus persalinus]|uniref:Pectinacetylesterase family protein n=1 Tax=Pseudocohnilembus persalinus TaxID=266149 RepID=A0A0V0R525_PSEPJ|nr:hypothetical protein PPERSA_12241 [Pseudocohnilembus persalinus]|eukprot:KRX09498.1 hypothetical protein PPERSA_12241 [Pseudocohnilembus persalinus]